MFSPESRQHTLLGNWISQDIPSYSGDIRALFERMLQMRWLNREVLEEESFFHPKLEDLHDPFLFPQMDTAVERILQAKSRGERVVIFGDYDVDGVSSTAMLMRFFALIGISVSARIPHRVHDGYGMKTYFFEELAQKGVSLVVSVDCWTRDIEVIRQAKSLGVDVIVTDHHAIPEEIPEEAIAIISPKLPGSSYPFSGLSGSGTAFKLLCAVASRLYSGIEYENLITSFIDFAALGTVADMMPLLGENRTIVKLGLAQIAQSRSPGLRALAAGKSLRSADIIGFHIGPRINAAGRMESATTALRALICWDEQVETLLSEIESLNMSRKTSTEKHMELALAQIDPRESVLCFFSEEIDHGIIGLVAWRLAERFGKPAIVCASDGTKVFGSARSQPEYDITSALSRIAHLFIAYGGHAQAAGFTLNSQNFEEFRVAIQSDRENFLKSAKQEEGEGTTLQEPGSSGGKEMIPDTMLTLGDLSLDFVRQIEQFGPYGMGFKKPLFLLRMDRIPACEFLGSSGLHLKFTAPKWVKLTAFWLGPQSEIIQNMHWPVWCIGEIDRESWQGRESVAFFIRDIIPL